MDHDQRKDETSWTIRTGRLKRLMELSELMTHRKLNLGLIK